MSVQDILRTNGEFKSELMEAFLCNRLNDTSISSRVDSEGNLMSPPSTTSSTSTETTSTLNSNQQLLNNRAQYQNDNCNNTATFTPLNNNGNGNGNGNTQTVASSNLSDPNANTECDVLLKEVKESVSPARRELLQTVTDFIEENHMNTCLNTYKNVAEAEAKIAENMKAGNMPDMSQLADNAPKIWQKFVSQMVPEITKAVKFCNRLPGFKELNLEDQVLLIKQASFQVLLTRFCMLINTETGDMIDPSLSIKFPRHALSSMPMGALLMEFYKVAEKFNPLGLTDGEIGLFSAILVMAPDCPGIQNRADVEKIQGLFKQAVYLQIKKNHTDGDSIFTKMMATIPVLREVSDKHAKALSKMKMSAPTEYDNTFQPLHKEIFEQ